MKTYLSVMATCSSIAEPVLVFQLPYIDVLLKCAKQTDLTKLGSLFTLKAGITVVSSYIHVGFVVWTNLLDSYVVLGFDERFCGGVCLGESHNTGYVLELTVIVHLHLYTKTREGHLALRWLLYRRWCRLLKPPCPACFSVSLPYPPLTTLYSSFWMAEHTWIR